MLLNEFLQDSANRFPEKEALVFNEKRMTYAEIEIQSNKLAHGLIVRGIERGDRVAIYLDNSIESVISIFAILKAGAVFLVINRSTKDQKLAFVLNNCRARAIITDASAAENLDLLKSQLPYMNFAVFTTESQSAEFGIDNLLFHQIMESNKDSLPPVRGIDIDLAALIYTSGSTGNPKGVMMTHLNMVSAATSITTYLENASNDIILNVLPLSFDYGLYQVLMAAKMGATVILEKSFAYPFVVIKKLISEKVTGFPIVPTISAILLQLEALTKYTFEHLRYISNTGAHLPTEHIRRLQAIFPGTRIYAMYGLTECKRVTYLPPDQLAIRPTSVGRGMPNEEIYLVNESNERLGPDQEGELVVRGSNVMQGYWEMPEATAAVLKPGKFPWERVLYTGDIFKTDAEGYLYFIGRKDDIIKSRGEKVSPKEVENIIYNLSGVAEVAVIGIKDEVLGEAIKAFVVPVSGAPITEKEIIQHCAGNLEDFMVPKIVEIRHSLPKTSTGKIRKTELT
ncbi:AMP-binding protein [candidate division KSB1 bacterium]|nr:AMP-binding protein [candidate division KSB1 bacterium]